MEVLVVSHAALVKTAVIQYGIAPKERMKCCKCHQLRIARSHCKSHWNRRDYTQQEDIFESYLEELPDNDPLRNPSYKVIKCISLRISWKLSKRLKI